MNAPMPWLAVALAVIALGLALVGAVVLWRRTRIPPVSAEERAELAAAPMPPLQRIAWAGLLVGVIQCLGIGAVFAAKGGADVYWEDDRMRLQVVGIFLAGLILSGVLSVLAHFKADERERNVLAWGPRIQSAAVLVALGLGTIFLVERFHDQGAIPVVWAYLGLGSIFIVHMTANFLGILLGFRATRFHAQG